MTPSSSAPLLERADQLASSGRVLDAIDALTALPAGERSSDVEIRLVELRYRAIEELPTTPALDSWPRRVPDPFPDVVGRPPAITRDELDAATLAGAIEHHGALIVRGLVSPADVTALREAVNNAFAARAEDPDLPDRDAWYHGFEAGEEHKMFGSKRFVRIIDSPRALQRLIDIYRGIGLVDVVTEHLGERPALSAHKCALRRLTPEPGERSLDYHQDGAFLGKGIRTVNTWLALSSCGGDSLAPGIDMVPRRIDRILETGVDGAHLDWTASEAVVERAAAGTAIVRPEFEPGDAMLFDELMVHRTGFSDDMTEERIAIESWFFAPSVYPDDHVPLVV